MVNQTPLHEFETIGVDALPAAVDIGLRTHMLRVYNHMADGLALTGAIAYAGAVSGFYTANAGTPILSIVLLAPLAMVFFLSFRIQTMSLTTAQLSL